MKNQDIIDAIEAIAARDGIAPATVTSRVAGNSRLYHRLIAGGGCTLVTAEKIIQFSKEKRRKVSV